MGKDYYAILEVKPLATFIDISKSFRVLALKYHPKKQTDPTQVAQSNHKFAEVCEAYEVLSNRK